MVWGGGGVDGHLPWVFVALEYFEKIVPLVESPCGNAGRLHDVFDFTKIRNYQVTAEIDIF